MTAPAETQTAAQNAEKTVTPAAVELPFSLDDLAKARAAQKAAAINQPKPERTGQTPPRPPFGTRRSMGKR